MQNMFIRIFVFALLVINISYSQVTEQWVQRFTSDSIRNESINDMFVDAEGNVYVTGSQRQTSANLDIQAVTVKYNSQGVQQWIQNFIDPNNHGALCRAIHVDDAGYVYVVGDNGVYGPPYEMLVIKYSPTGTQLWSNRFTYAASTVNRGFDIITDLIGNVYVTGEYSGDAMNVILVKYDPNGGLVNQTAFNRGSEGGRKIALDGAGKIIIGGFINNDPQNTTRFLVLKYEQNLDFVWGTTIGNGAPGNPYTAPPDIAIDINSNIILTGQNELNYATIKLGPDGVVLWTKIYSSGYDLPRAVVTDNIGNIYVTGETGNAGFPFTYDFCTIKYNPNGDELWVRALKPTLPSDGYAGYDITIDNSSNIYVTGNSHTGQNMITAKYNSEGTLQWTESYSGATVNSGDYAVAVGIDQNGNTFIAGNSNNNNSTTGNDIAIIKYVQTSTSMDDGKNFPLSFSLEQNYPNPFNPSTSIQYRVSSNTQVSLKVYDVLGNEVATLVNDYREAGSYEVEFGASQLSTGIYFYKLQAGSFVETKKMIVIK